jgi:hypothetical protein
MFIETVPHSELIICDKYREETALSFPQLLCSAFSQRSDFNHSTSMTERGSTYVRKNILQKMKFQRNCWRTHLMFLTTLIVTVKMTVTLLLLEIGKTKLYRISLENMQLDVAGLGALRLYHA